MAIQVKTQTRVQTAPRKRVGILGGTFNPPHLGHLMIGEQVVHQLQLDEVRFMPNALPPHVDTKIAIDPLERAAMVQAAVHDNHLFTLEMIEIKRGGKSYTYDSIVALREQNPDTDFYFIIGGDEVAYLPTWHRIDELVDLVHFVGVNRPGVVKEAPYPVQWVDVPQLEISSTEIRQRVANHNSIRYMVPDMVAAYIFKKGLYLDEK